MSRRARSTFLTATRVAGHVLYERLLPRNAVAATDVPASASVITPAWWTAILGTAVPGAAVLEQHVLSASSGTHQRHRFALTWNDAGTAAKLPAAVFTKTLPTVVTRMIGGYNGTARAEGRFYRELRPALAIEAPQGYHAAFDRRSLAGINVLEDIATTRSATFCDAQSPVTRSMAEDMLRLLARVHAYRFADTRLDHDVPWLANFAEWFRIGSRKMRTEAYTRQAITQLADQLPSTIVDGRDQIWPATLSTAAIHDHGPRGLLHSDVHIGNWYRIGTGAMGLCDWQCVAKGHWSRDVAYMLATALTVEDRRAWERDLLSLYVDELARLTGVRIDVAAAWNDYRRQLLHALWMWTITLCHSPLLPAMQSRETSTTMIIRIATAMADLDSLAAAK